MGTIVDWKQATKGMDTMAKIAFLVLARPFLFGPRLGAKREKYTLKGGSENM